MDWTIWRVVMSDKIAATLHEVETCWSIDDLLDAHALLDAFEDAQAKAALKARQK